MSHAEWKRKMPWEKTWEGPRPIGWDELVFSNEETEIKFGAIYKAMEGPKLIVFHYGDSDRIVAPFVLGFSSENTALMRGFQLEGTSRSGKGAGWRVFQILWMEDLADHQEFFNPDEFDFDRNYPWLYKVYKTL
jgi:hypothetical protein